MRKLLAATALAVSLLASPALAQEQGGVCYTFEAAADAATKTLPGATILITLRSIDIGFSEPADVTVWGKDGVYLGVAFVGGCYAGYRIMDDAEVEEFINSHTKKADTL